MRKFSELTLTEKQEEFVDKWMYKWGVWIRSGRLNKPQLNIIAKLMQSVIASEPGEPMCSDEEGLMISEVIEQFFVKNDRTLHFIVFSYYVNKCSVNRITVILHENAKATRMHPCVNKPNIRTPSFRTVYREVEKELRLSKAIIHELLVTGFVLLRNCSKNAKNIKIKY